MGIHTSGKPEGGRLLSLISGQIPTILVLTALMAFGLSAAAIQYQVTIMGPTCSTGCLNDPTLRCNDELDPQFDPTLFGQLSNGVAGTGFDLLLFQPNNPPQAPGDYSALAIVDHPSLGQPFRVDFTVTGTPGSQPYSINQFHSNGNFKGVVTSGRTVLVNAVPERAGFC